MDQPARTPARTLPSRGEFDEDAYLQLYPDIAQGVSAGAIESGWRHFVQHGFAEGRPWLARPDPFAGVSQDIAPGDEMFTGNAEHYFDVGASALRCIEAALFAARRNPATVRRILDLPCGHGRVMRFLRKAYPQAEMTACDLNADGVAHCARAFGAVPVVSREEVDAIPLTAGFDLIWCGSLLTHLTEERCAAFLRFFHRVLKPGGLAVFTTHGRLCAAELAAGKNRHNLEPGQIAGLLEDYRRTGFAYVDYVSHPGYGFSLSHPAFVLERWVAPTDWRLISYHENGWDHRQDAVCLEKQFPR
ncbi:MAG TPA: class I SAM-dependent methyltransferase [Lacunisphaera sp.]